LRSSEAVQLSERTRKIGDIPKWKIDAKWIRYLIAREQASAPDQAGKRI
jgi:hypothetical protein